MKIAPENYRVKIILPPRDAERNIKTSNKNTKHLVMFGFK